MKQPYKWGGIAIAILAIVGLFALSRTFQSTGGDFAMEKTFSSGSMEGSAAYDMAAEPMAYDALPATPGVEESIAVEDAGEERLVIKTGSITMVVTDVAQGIANIGNYAKANDGFVLESSISKYGVAPTGYITIRIPVALFDAGFEDVKAMGEVRDQRTSGTDVTEEYVDLEARMTNLKATEAQFLQIMTRAVKIEDVLAVQRELSNVRSEIERLEGRMKYLRESAAMATLTVSLSTDPDALPVLDEDKWRPFGNAKESLRDMVEWLQYMVDDVIRVVIFLPVVLLYLAGFWVLYRIGKWGYLKVKK